MKNFGYLFLVVFLTLGMGCAKTDTVKELDKSGDDLKKLSKSEKVFTANWKGDNGYVIELYCGDEYMDALEGLLYSHWTWQARDGYLEWVHINFSGTLMSEDTEVTYTIKESDKLYFEEGATWDTFWGSMESYHFRFNVMGDDGSHYIGSADWNPKTGETIYIRADCVPQKNGVK